MKSWAGGEGQGVETVEKGSCRAGGSDCIWNIMSVRLADRMNQNEYVMAETATLWVSKY